MDDYIDTEYGLMRKSHESARLKDLCHAEGGIQTGPFGSQLHQKDYVDVGTPIVTVENLGENRIESTDVPRVSDADRERLGRYSLKEGDIVFSRVGSVDRRALIRKTEDGWLFSGRCIRVRPDPAKIDSGFLSWFFGLTGFVNHINSIAVGATMPSLNTSIMEGLPIYYPSLEEQRTIAHILGTLDDKIELNRRMNETLEGIARALFKSWFIDFDPVRAKAEGRQPFGMDAETAALFPDQFEDSELGEIPKGWKIGAIQDYYDILGGTTPSTKVAGYWGGSIPFATPKDLSTVSSSYLVSTERSITDEGLSQIGSGIIRKGSFLLSSRAPIGYMAFNDVDVAINQGIIAAASKSSLSPSYIYFWSSFKMEYIKSVANGSTFLEVSKGSFKKLKMLAPPSELIGIFNSHVDQQLSAILNNEKENRTLVELRDSLLPKLISGEIRVNGIGVNI